MEGHSTPSLSLFLLPFTRLFSPTGTRAAATKMQSEDDDSDTGATCEILCALGDFQYTKHSDVPDDPKPLTMRSFLQALSEGAALTRDVVERLQGDLQVQVRGGTCPGRYDRLERYFRELEMHAGKIRYPKSIMICTPPDTLHDTVAPNHGAPPHYKRRMLYGRLLENEMESCPPFMWANDKGWRIQIHFRGSRAQMTTEDGFPTVAKAMSSVLEFMDRTGQRMSLSDKMDLFDLEEYFSSGSVSVHGKALERRIVEMCQNARFVFESPQGVGECSSWEELVAKVTKGGDRGVIRECDIGLYLNEDEKALITPRLRYLSYIYGSAEQNPAALVSTPIGETEAPRPPAGPAPDKEGTVYSLHTFSDKAQIDINHGWFLQVSSTYPYAFDVGFDSSLTTSEAFEEELNACLEATGHATTHKIHVKDYFVRVSEGPVASLYLNVEQIKNILPFYQHAYNDKPRRLNIELANHQVRPPKSLPGPMTATATIALDRIDSGTYIDKLRAEQGNTPASYEILSIMRAHKISPASHLGLDLLNLSRKHRLDGNFASSSSPTTSLQVPPVSLDNSTTSSVIEEAVKTSLQPVEERLNEFAEMLNTIAESVGVNLIENDDDSDSRPFVVLSTPDAREKRRTVRTRTTVSGPLGSKSDRSDSARKRTSPVMGLSTRLMTSHINPVTPSDTEVGVEDDIESASTISPDPFGDISTGASPARELLNSVAIRARALSVLSVEDPRSGSKQIAASPILPSLGEQSPMATSSGASVVSSLSSDDMPVPVRRSATPRVTVSDISTTVPDSDYHTGPAPTENVAQAGPPVSILGLEPAYPTHNPNANPNAVPGPYRYTASAAHSSQALHPDHYRQFLRSLEAPSYSFGAYPTYGIGEIQAPGYAGHMPAMPGFPAHPGPPSSDPYVPSGYHAAQQVGPTWSFGADNHYAQTRGRDRERLFFNRP